MQKEPFSLYSLYGSSERCSNHGGSVMKRLLRLGIELTRCLVPIWDCKLFGCATWHWVFFSRFNSLSHRNSLFTAQALFASRMIFFDHCFVSQASSSLYDSKCLFQREAICSVIYSESALNVHTYSALSSPYYPFYSYFSKPFFFIISLFIVFNVPKFVCKCKL